MTPSVKAIFMAALVCGAGAARVRRAGTRGLGSEGAAASDDEGVADAAAAAAAAARRNKEEYAAAAGNSILEPGSHASAHASRLAAVDASSAQLPLVALEVARGAQGASGKIADVVLGKFKKGVVSKMKGGVNERIIVLSVRIERWPGLLRRVPRPTPPPPPPPPPLSV